jgi:hypothetical protein
VPKLNDLQSILLATAAQRDSGSLYPLAESTAGTGARLKKALTALAKAGLVQERETSDKEATCRTEGDCRYGLFITAAGAAAIGIGEEPAGPAQAAPELSPAATPRTSKTADVIAMLQRDSGATLPELVEATGWLPHTTRAALTGLRKKGHAIARGKRDELTCYTLGAAAEA